MIFREADITGRRRSQEKPWIYEKARKKQLSRKPYSKEESAQDNANGGGDRTRAATKVRGTAERTP